MNLSIEQTLTAWSGGRVIRALEGGFRNEVYLVDTPEGLRVAKTTRRSEEAVAWLMPVHEAAKRAGFVVPKLLKSAQGCFVVKGVTLECFIEGKALQDVPILTLKPMLTTFHTLTQQLPQRPGFASSTELLTRTAGGDVDFSALPTKLVSLCREIWSQYQQKTSSIIHGDLNKANMLLSKEGKLALIDWDESRKDLSLFDQIALEKKCWSAYKQP